MTTSKGKRNTYQRSSCLSYSMHQPQYSFYISVAGYLPPCVLKVDMGTGILLIPPPPIPTLPPLPLPGLGIGNSKSGLFPSRTSLLCCTCACIDLRTCGGN